MRGCDYRGERQHSAPRRLMFMLHMCASAAAGAAALQARRGRSRDRQRGCAGLAACRLALVGVWQLSPPTRPRCLTR
jgi:hypothetical protein